MKKTILHPALISAFTAFSGISAALTATSRFPEDTKIVGEKAVDLNNIDAKSPHASRHSIANNDAFWNRPLNPGTTAFPFRSHLLLVPKTLAASGGLTENFNHGANCYTQGAFVSYLSQEGSNIIFTHKPSEYANAPHMVDLEGAYIPSNIVFWSSSDPDSIQNQDFIITASIVPATQEQVQEYAVENSKAYTDILNSIAWTEKNVLDEFKAKNAKRLHMDEARKRFLGIDSEMLYSDLRREYGHFVPAFVNEDTDDQGNSVPVSYEIFPSGQHNLNEILRETGIGVKRVILLWDITKSPDGKSIIARARMTDHKADIALALGQAAAGGAGWVFGNNPELAEKIPSLQVDMLSREETGDPDKPFSAPGYGVTILKP
ncbi:MAG: hypothetical protein L6Q57_07260 [Alphaproteobacteria bacterium]|nr:hypothetical protein [Alphaproteobacteria bacterium]